jgi:Spy/CpxP family protein refolding chaperone
MSGKARAGLAAVGLITIGFALGVFGDHLWLAHRPHGSDSDSTHAERMVQMLHTLDLTTEQREAIDTILVRYHGRVEEQLAEVHPMLLATIDSARHEIEAVLDSDQLDAFHDWLRTEHQRLQDEELPFIRH